MNFHIILILEVIGKIVCNLFDNFIGSAVVKHARVNEILINYFLGITFKEGLQRINPIFEVVAVCSTVPDQRAFHVF